MTASDWTTFGKTSGGGGGGSFLRPNKLQPEQAVKFRILGSPIEGFERWTDDNKPVCIGFGEPWPVGPKYREKEQDGKKSVPKMFAAMPVWNYAEDSVQVLAFTQAVIREALVSYAGHEEYGQPTGYDLTLKRKGSGKDTTYELVASPPKPCPDKAVEAWNKVVENGFDLRELFSGGNPFQPQAAPPF